MQVGGSMARLCLLVLLGAVTGVLSLNDYWNHFCGKQNCYELLSVPVNASQAEIKKAYRGESLRWHPDKNPSKDAKKRFQAIAKAYEVLTNETHREKYDHFRENPGDYWVEYGNYYYTTYAPKSDVRGVLLAFLVIISVFVPLVQYNKHKNLVDFLKRAAIKNLGLQSGGTKETLDIRRRALELRDQYREDQKNNGDSAKDRKLKKKLKDEEDPDLIRAVNEIVDSMEIKGPYRKPIWNDVLAYQLVKLPYTLSKWIHFQAKWYYDHSVQKLALTPQEEEYLAEKTVGHARWEALEPEDQEEMIKARIWEEGNYEHYKEAKLAEELKKRPGHKKRMLRYRKKAAAGEGYEEGDEDSM